MHSFQHASSPKGFSFDFVSCWNSWMARKVVTSRQPMTKYSQGNGLGRSTFAYFRLQKLIHSLSLSLSLSLKWFLDHPYRPLAWLFDRDHRKKISHLVPKCKWRNRTPSHEEPSYRTDGGARRKFCTVPARTRILFYGCGLKLLHTL